MDNEIKGVGNSLNYKYRMHDSRLGRFFAVDPLFKKYPHNSTYAFSENVVINAVELEGLEKYYTNDGVYLGQVGNNQMKRIFKDVYSTSKKAKLIKSKIHLINELQSNPPSGAMKEGKSVSKQLAKELYSNSEFLSMKLKINGEEIEIGGREHPEQLSTYTSTDKSLSNFYMKKYQNKLQEEKNVPLSDPVFSGYFGGANQYPIIREALFASFSFEKKLSNGAINFVRKYFTKVTPKKYYSNVASGIGKTEKAKNLYYKIKMYYTWGKVITGNTESQKEYNEKIQTNNESN